MEIDYYIAIQNLLGTYSFGLALSLTEPTSFNTFSAGYYFKNILF